MVSKELKSLTDRAFANSKPTLNLVKIHRFRGGVEERIDLRHRTRDA